MKNRILVCKQPGDGETRCEYCNKLIETAKYKTHLKQVHEIGVKKAVKMIAPVEVTGIDPATDQRIIVKQNEFEQNLTVLCPFCKMAIVNKSFTTHMKEHHEEQNDKINSGTTPKRIPVICPLCRVSVAPPLRNHIRKVHYMELDSFAGGLYDTTGTIKKREEFQKGLKNAKRADKIVE